MSGLSKKHRVFVDKYLETFNATKAYLFAYPHVKEHTARVNGSKLLADTSIQVEINGRLKEIHMGADEALKRLAAYTDVDISFFFKIVDEWMFYPLPSYEILEEKEVVDDTKDPPEKRISYRVRHVVLDMDRVIDPRYSWMLKSFSDSSKFGLKIEMLDKQAALRDVLKIAGKFVDRTDITTGGEKITKVIIEHVRSGGPDTTTGTSPGPESGQAD